MKKISLFIVTILFAVAQGMKAETVTTADALISAVTTDGNNIKLGADIALPDPLVISVKVNIDMDGHKLTHQKMVGHDSDYNCIFAVANTGELNLSDGTIANVTNTTQDNSDYNAGAIASKGTVTLDRVTISGCSGLKGGAIRNHPGATLTLSSCTLDSNNSTGSSTDGFGNGGAIYNEGTLTITTTTFTTNKADNLAGAIWNTGNLSISGSTFKYNEASSVSCIYHATVPADDKTPVTITGSSFEGNNATGDSGCGVIKTNEGTTKMTISGNTSFNYNEAMMYGAAIYCESVMELNKVNFDTNGSGKYGGAVFVSPNGNMTMNNNTNFTGCFADKGGAIYNYGKLILSDVTISGNTANEYGGGVVNEGTMNIGASVVIKNNAGNGGGISNLYLKDGKIVTVTDALTNSMVHLDMEKWGLFTSGYKKYNADTDPATFFAPDADARFYAAIPSGDEVALSLKPVITIDNETDLRDAVALDFEKVNIKLTADITLGALVDITKNTITIDLDGHTLDRGLTARGNAGQVFAVREGATLNLSNGTLTGGWGGDSGGIDNFGTANLTDVTITGCTGDDRGGGICNFGMLNMTGGAITDNISNDHTTPEGGGGIFNAEGATMTLANVTITGNEAKVKGGGGICNYGTMTIDGCTIQDNIAKKNGGGIWNDNDATLSINGGNISGNTADDQGGGIYTHSSFSMQGAVKVTDNKGEDGMSSNVYLMPDAVITVTGSLAGSNIGVLLESYGGTFTSGYKTNNDGIDPATLFTPDMDKIFDVTPYGDEAALSIQSLITVDNDADLRTAIIFDGANISVTADIDLSNSTLSIDENKTISIDLGGHKLDRKLTQRGESGGQVITVRKSASLNLSNGTLAGGWGGHAGGISNEGGTAVLTDVTITGCVGDDAGGAIWNASNGTFTMTGGAITNNKSNDHNNPSGGGGMFNAEGATATLTGVSITGNTTVSSGGGGFNNYGTLTLDGCTITGNTSKAHGGAIWTAAGSTLNMQGKLTISDNQGSDIVNNVYLKEGALITVTGSLEGSSIGISMETLGVFTSGYKSNNPSLSPEDCFVCDKENCKLGVENNEVKLEEGQSDETNLNDVKAVGTNIDADAWYDFQGHQLNGKPTVRGTYIHGKRKVLVP